MSETPPNLTNEPFTKERFHNVLIDYLVYCPTEEKEYVMEFLRDLYSINMHTLFKGDAIDELTDKIDITTGTISSSCLVNFLITTRTRTDCTFSDMSDLIDSHLVTLTEMISSTGVHKTDTTLNDNSPMLKYIMLIRIYLDLNLIYTIKEKSSDNRI